MKYIVEVNAKYLVSVEAETALQAEHKILEYNGIWGALAFDRQALKTDTFAGAVQGCEMISLTDLISLVNQAMDAKLRAAKAEEVRQAAFEALEALQAQLEAAEKAYEKANRECGIQLDEYTTAVDTLGRERR